MVIGTDFIAQRIEVGLDSRMHLFISLLSTCAGMESKQSPERLTFSLPTQVLVEAASALANKIRKPMKGQLRRLDGAHCMAFAMALALLCFPTPSSGLICSGRWQQYGLKDPTTYELKVGNASRHHPLESYHLQPKL